MRTIAQSQVEKLPFPTRVQTEEDFAVLFTHGNGVLCTFLCKRRVMIGYIPHHEVSV